MLRRSNPTQQITSSSSSPMKTQFTQDVVKQFTNGEITKKVESEKSVLAPSRKQSGTELWVDTFAPTKSSDLVGNDKHITELKEWLKTWEKKYQSTRNEKQKKGAEFKRAVMISGVPGIGKVCC